MATPNLFDERLEANPGYDNVEITEGVSGGCTLNEDALSSAIGSPAGWGTQCLQAIVDAGTHYARAYKALASAQSILYLRVSFYIISESLADGQTNQIIEALNSASANVLYLGIYQSGTSLYLRCRSYHDGAQHFYTSLTTLAVNTRYLAEFKWDATNDRWGWRLNGIAQPNDQDSSDPITSEGLLTSTHPTDVQKFYCGLNDCAAAMEVWLDLWGMDSTAWIGDEAGAETQTIYPSGIASSEVFGTAKVNLVLLASGITTGEAFGSPTIILGILAQAIASLESFGTAKLSFKLLTQAIISAEAFGTHLLRLFILTTSIASGEVFGTAKLILSIMTLGIVSAEAFGSHIVKIMLQFILPTVISSVESFGSAVISSGMTAFLNIFRRRRRKK